VYVPPQFRQQGHFKSLYKHVREEAQKAGATGLRLYADMGNERAHTAVSSPADLYPEPACKRVDMQTVKAQYSLYNILGKVKGLVCGNASVAPVIVAVAECPHSQSLIIEHQDS
jgi:hypothetical protein